MKKRIVGRSSGIPILIGHHRMEYEGYTEIMSAFRLFDGSSPEARGLGHPEAEKYMDRLRPRPLAAAGVQPFKHVRNDDISKLFKRWERQLDKLRRAEEGRVEPR